MVIGVRVARLGAFSFYIASNIYVSAVFVRGRLWRLLLCNDPEGG